MKAGFRFLLAREKKLFFEKEKRNNNKKIQPTRKNKKENGV
jgi:hypothetical protein